MKKFFNLTRNILEYLMACAIAVVFALFCSGRVGYFILFVLILTPLLSLLITWAAALTTRVRSDISADICQKGSGITLNIELKKSISLLPFPGIRPVYESIGGLKDEGAESVRVGRNRRERRVKVVFSGVYSGRSIIRLKEIYFEDFLGIARFKAGRFEGAEYKVGVIPKVRLIPPESELLRDALAGADMTGLSEDTVDEIAGNFGGFPGYDHREYMPGDPVRRINYKLSARKDQYFVRLDEKQVYGDVEIVLDPGVPEDVVRKGDAEVAAWWDNRLQDTLGLCETLLSRQFSVTLKFMIEEEEMIRQLKLPGDGAALCEELAWCGYVV